jgi:signal transduction histidine kinase
MEAELDTRRHEGPNLATARASARAETLFREHLFQVQRQTDLMFAALMAVQWVFAIVIALVVSPWAWEGKVRSVHVHVYAALILGGLLSGLPIAMVLRRPGWVANRYVIAVAQVLWSALFIHLTGGRIETHFHIFVSLAFLSFYRDWRVLVPATIVVAADHLIRGLLWPESVYGILFPEWWRFLEHAFWVVFEDVVLVFACLQGEAELRAVAERRAQVEILSEIDRGKSDDLAVALYELEKSQEARMRTEKLAAVGQLAASVGHELRNPLAAVRNAATYVHRRVTDPRFAGQPASADPKVAEFMQLMFRELDASGKIISDLLDFARERKPAMNPCPLRPLVQEALTVIPQNGVRVVNEVPEDLPVPSLDKDQFRQILVNLIQNGMEAASGKPDAQVVVRAEGGAGRTPWVIRIIDNGSGMPREVLEKIFQPLYTTKVKGTGLGLAVVWNVVHAHKATIEAKSEEGKGSQFIIALPAAGVAAAE